MSEISRTPSAVSAQAADSVAAKTTIAVLTAVVLALIVVVIYVVPHQKTPEAPSPVATLNALLNGAAAVCLVAGFAAIRRGRISVHRRFMLAAFAFSTAFLVGYVVHHATAGSVPYGGQGMMRIVYFSLLIPHIVLAAPVLPMALLTLYRGLTDKRVTHRKIARITLPIWLFVSVSGVLVYLMLYHG